MNPIILKKRKERTFTSGMPDIPLVIFRISDEGIAAGLDGDLADAFRDMGMKDGMVFYGEGCRLLLLWGTPSEICCAFEVAVRKRTGLRLQMFGCRSDGLPEGTPKNFSLQPLGIAVRTDGDICRISGAAGVVSIKSFCAVLRKSGMQSDAFERHIKKLMKKKLSGKMPWLEYRRAEEEVTQT